MSADKWSKEEDRKLLLLANDYRSESGKTIMWKDVPMGRFFRSVSATQNRWNMFMKHKVEFKDGQYVLPSTPLDTPKPIKTPTKDTAISVRPKVRKVKKSFLWGLYTVVREE